MIYTQQEQKIIKNQMKPHLSSIKALVFGAPSKIKNRSEMNAEQLLNRTGQNTGNLLIGYGLRKEIVHSVWDPWHPGIKPQDVKGNYDCVVIPASNFIRDIKLPEIFYSFTDFLEKTSLKCFVVGLGAQAPKTTSYYNIPDETLGFLKIISERTNVIGVRGEYTANLLNENSIKNIQITGCPPYYMNCTPSIIIKRENNTDRIAINGSRNVVSHAFDKQIATNIEKQLMCLAFENNFDFILQNEMPELLFAMANEKEIKNINTSSIQKFYKIDPCEQFVTYMKDHMKIFFDVEDWAKEIVNYGFVIGTRIHGNLIGIINGVPAFCIAHDSRTLELCEFLGIPYLPITKILKIDKKFITKVLEEYDYQSIINRYEYLYQEYIRFFGKNDIPHNLSGV